MSWRWRRGHQAPGLVANRSPFNVDVGLNMDGAAGGAVRSKQVLAAALRAKHAGVVGDGGLAGEGTSQPVADCSASWNPGP